MNFIKANLNTRDEDILTLQLKVSFLFKTDFKKLKKMLQKLLLCDDLVGQALVPYYRQLLPIFRLFYSKNSNLGDFIDYSQRKGQNLGDLIEETLQMMESTGGEVFLKFFFYIN